MVRKKTLQANVLVVGLGRFGTALARELMDSGSEVLGIDMDERLVQLMSTELTHCVKADSTDETTLLELGAAEFDCAVVAIGGDLESSILTTSLLLQLGVKRVWAKANSEPHGKILKQLGVHHVVFPEKEMGQRVAHMVTGESLEYLPIDENLVMAKTDVAEEFAGKTLQEIGIRSTYGVTVMAISKNGQPYEPAVPSTVLEAGSQILVAGAKKPLQDFCRIQ